MDDVFYALYDQIEYLYDLKHLSAGDSLVLESSPYHFLLKDFSTDEILLQKDDVSL
ncbi:MAG: hypothetical protein GXP45_08035 [bacterium]|nr:hypothetical protein [bacterium]